MPVGNVRQASTSKPWRFSISPMPDEAQLRLLNRWVVHFSPLLLKRFNGRKRAAGGKWHMDETYIKVQGQWMYLYRAIDSTG
jgi:transposase-like protein